MITRPVAGWLVAAGLCWCAAVRLASAPDEAPTPGLRSVNDGVYTAAQAKRGEDAFEHQCESCHEPERFTGRAFVAEWQGPLDALFNTIRTTMPEDNPASLPPQTYADVMAYFLKLNGFPSGPDHLDGSVDVMQYVRLEPPSARADQPRRDDSPR